MKWTIDQLKKQAYQDNTFESVVDVSQYMPKDEDILDVKAVNVKGEFEIEDDEYYHFDIQIKTTLTVACSRSLKPVELALDFDVSETFSHDEKDDYRQIDGITIDLLPIIWSNIYLEKPMRVIHPDAQDMAFDEKETREEEINPTFKDLEDYKS